MLQETGMEITVDMSELYIGLLCRFEPQSVLSFLESTQNYKLEPCLRLCQEHGVTDASAYLLERMGNVTEALSLQLSEVGRTTEAAVRAEDAQTRAAADAALQAAVALCQRNSSRVNDPETEALWFQLLDHVLKPLVDGKGGNYATQHDMLMRRTEMIMARMMGFIPMRAILDKIMADYSRCALRDLRSALVAILGSYNYEASILSSALQIVDHDVFESGAQRLTLAARAVKPRHVTFSAGPASSAPSTDARSSGGGEGARPPQPKPKPASSFGGLSRLELLDLVGEEGNLISDLTAAQQIRRAAGVEGDAGRPVIGKRTPGSTPVVATFVATNIPGNGDEVDF